MAEIKRRASKWAPQHGCSVCGKEVHEGWMFCNHHKMRWEMQPEPPAEFNAWTASQVVLELLNRFTD